MKSTAPDITQIPLPIDQWTQPFWDAAARHELILPRCADCQTWRWPPTPFCPKCRSQAIKWLPAGPARLFSYSVVHRPGPTPEEPLQLIIPGLVEFPEAGGMRIVAAIVDSEVEQITIGSSLNVHWAPKDGTNVPTFSVA